MSIPDLSKENNVAEIPSEGPYNHIFEKRLEEKFILQDLKGYSYCFISSIFSLKFSIILQMIHLWGLGMTLKNIIKISSPSRMFYCLTSDQDGIVSTGWIQEGWCRRYMLSRRNFVMEHIYTVEKERGKGLMTYTLKKTINSLIDAGFEGRTIYIDTFCERLDVPKIIRKCGFQGPIHYFLREFKNAVLTNVQS